MGLNTSKTKTIEKTITIERRFPLRSRFPIVERSRNIFIIGEEEQPSPKSEPYVQWLTEHSGVHVFRGGGDNTDRITGLYDPKWILLNHLIVASIGAAAVNYIDVPAAERTDIMRSMLLSKTKLAEAMLNLPSKDTPYDQLNKIKPKFSISTHAEKNSMIIHSVFGWLRRTPFDYVDIYKWYFEHDDPCKEDMKVLLSMTQENAFRFVKGDKGSYFLHINQIQYNTLDNSAVERIKARYQKNIDDLIVVFTHEDKCSHLAGQLMTDVKVITRKLSSIEGKTDIIFSPLIKDLKPFVSSKFTCQLEVEKSVSDWIERQTCEEKISNSAPNAHVWKEETTKLYEKHRETWEKYIVRKGWFISYKQKDGSSALVERLFNNLEGDNWYDMMHKGERTRAAMIKGICRRDNFICFVSPHYFSSQWCCMELTVAMKLNKTIVPVYNQDERSAGVSLGFVPECFQMLKQRDFIGLFMDMGPCLGQIEKIKASVNKSTVNEFDDSEEDLIHVN